MQLFREAVERYLQNPRTPVDRFFLPEECDFLASIGHKPGEMHGFVQDYAVMGEPSPSSALLIASTRRSFFLTAQRGISGNAAPITAKDLPNETDDFQEIVYLPHIIRKAEAKLFGTLDPKLMFPNAKDRAFLREHGGIAPNDFLHLVWSTRSDRQKMITAVLNAIHQADEKNATAPQAHAPEPNSEQPNQEPRQTSLNFD